MTGLKSCYTILTLSRERKGPMATAHSLLLAGKEENWDDSYR